jgi:hypothetical protein
VTAVRAPGLVVALPPLLLAGAGLAHPMTLSTATSQRWTVLHVALVPVFPLLAVCLWSLLRAERGPVATLARVAAFVYACFYSALDTINGVAGGLVVQHVPGVLAGGSATLRPVLDLGNTLGWIGSSAFLIGAGLTGALLVRRHGRGALPGAVLTALAAVSFLDSHIYWPRGVVTMLVLAVGLLLLTRQLEEKT